MLLSCSGKELTGLLLSFLAEQYGISASKVHVAVMTGFDKTLLNTIIYYLCKVRLAEFTFKCIKGYNDTEQRYCSPEPRDKYYEELHQM